MTDATAAIGHIAELACCPRCRGPLPVGLAGACGRCGATCRVEGPVVDFLGPDAARMPGEADARMAEWLIANRAGPGIVASERALDTLGEYAGLSPAQAAEVSSNFELGQVVNDLKKILDDDAPASESARFVVEHGEIGADSTVLDVGCSCGRHLSEVAPLSPRLMAGVDIDFFALTAGAKAWDLRGTWPSPTWICASALALPFRDASFSHLNSIGTVVLLPVRAALREYARVLRPGGRLSITMEGMGSWRRYWDIAPVLGWRRLNLLRGLLGDRLLAGGLDWQGRAVVGRLSRHTQFTPTTLRRLAGRAGFEVDRCDVLRDYKGEPWIIGLTARKRDAGAATAARGG